MLCMQARLAATAGADFYSITEDSARVDSRRTIPFQFSYRCDAGGYHESILNTDVLLLRGIVPVCCPAYITKDYKLIPRGYVSKTDALQCDANQLLSDVLDVTTSQESGLVSRKLQALPVDEQRRLLRVLEVMIDER